MEYFVKGMVVGAIIMVSLNVIVISNKLSRITELLEGLSR